jgi:hypothetical protein
MPRQGCFGRGLIGLRSRLLSNNYLLYKGNIELILQYPGSLPYVIPPQMRAAAGLGSQIDTGDTPSTAILNMSRQGCFEGGFMGLRSLLLSNKYMFYKGNIELTLQYPETLPDVIPLE